jgi:hypothetical protein
MATTTPNFNWPVPTSTDLVKDGATAIEGLGDAIDASLLDLKGGTTNQVLAKNSNTDMDFKWVADASGIPATILDAKGDLIAATAADTASRLAVGANGTVLTADSAEATGLKWAAAAGGGSLTKISTVNMSGVSSQNFEGVFTSTYTFYTILIDNVYNSGSPGVDLFFEFLYSTNTRQTSNYYGGFYGANANGTYASIANSNVAAVNIGRMNSASDNSNFYVINMGAVGNSSVCPTGTVQTYSVGNGPSYGGAIHNETARVYTGFRLAPASNQISGTVSIYGWSK